VLNFSIVGVSNDSIADYAVLSSGRATEGHALYAARVVEFMDQDPSRKHLTAGWFGGGSRVLSAPVPLPGTAWLLASAIGWLTGARRRARRSAR
jgi:hypothetical protein